MKNIITCIGATYKSTYRLSTNTIIEKQLKQLLILYLSYPRCHYDRLSKESVKFAYTLLIMSPMTLSNSKLIP